MNNIGQIDCLKLYGWEIIYRFCYVDELNFCICFSGNFGESKDRNWFHYICHSINFKSLYQFINCDWLFNYGVVHSLCACVSVCRLYVQSFDTAIMMFHVSVNKRHKEWTPSGFDSFSMPLHLIFTCVFCLFFLPFTFFLTLELFICFTT